MITNKSGVSEQVLSLPKGGGSVRPIGDTFKADLFTGTGNFSVPINIPEGRNRLTPQLNLSYSSGKGNGPFGVGWHLPVLSISRKTSGGIPTYNNAEDTFVLDGADELVPIGDGIYKPRTEKYFAKIQMITALDGQPCWVVTTKDGVRNIIGNTADSRLADPENPNRIFSWLITESTSPNSNKIIYQYKKEDYAEPNPNNKRKFGQIYLASVDYVNYQKSGKEHFLYRAELDYGQLNQNGEDDGEWVLRSDPFSNFRSGFEIRTLRRCCRILIKVHGLQQQSDGYQLIRSYNLGYDSETLSRQSMLTSLTLKGYKLIEPVVDDELEYEISASPSMTFGYSEFKVDDRHFEKLESSIGFLPDKSMGDKDIELIDIFGNGLPDILETGEVQTRCWRNTGNGTFSGPHNVDKFPFRNRLSRGEVMLADASGNGAADLLVMDQTGGGFFGNFFNGEWDNYVCFERMPRIYSAGSQLNYMDINADGAIDLLSLNYRSIFYYTNESTDSKGRRCWEGPRKGKKGISEDSRDELLPTPENLKFADMTGDGMMDMLSIFSGRISYRPFLGNGKWGDEIVMLNSPQLERNYDSDRLFLTDINGSGFADLIYVAYDRVYYWINQSGNQWSDRQTIYYTPLAEPNSVRTADIKGTGTAGLLWSYSFTGTRRSNYRYLDFTGGKKPLLLDRIDNGFGAVTTVEYVPSTQYYLNDNKSGNGWKLPLPFPVQVVSKVTTHDHITKRGKTLFYHYHNGYYDGTEKEFRGFSLVEEIEEGDTDTPGTLRKNWFHPGTDRDLNGNSLDFGDDYFDDQLNLLPEVIIPPEISNKKEAMRSLRGVPLRTEIYGLDNSANQTTPFAINQNRFDVEEIHADIIDKPHDIFFPKAIETVVIKSERDGAPQRIKRVAQTYDDYGNIVEIHRQYNSLENPNLDPSVPTVVIKNRYHILDKQNSPVNLNSPYQPDYMVNRLIETIENEEHTEDGEFHFQLLGHTRYYYDGTEFQGQPLEQLPIVGNMSRSEVLVYNEHMLMESYGLSEIPQSLLSESGYRMEERDGQKWYWRQSDRFQMGDYGLPLASMDGRGNIMQIEYDDYLLLPIRATNALGSVKSSIFDYQSQQTKEMIDCNGNKTVYTYDPCGRLISSALMGKQDENGDFEGDSTDNPSMISEYHLSTVDINNPYPISIVFKKRQNHKADELLISREYYDGFGEVLQKRIQVDPGEFTGNIADDAAENWLVSGWQEYDCKGKPNRQYSPSLDITEDFRVTLEMIINGAARVMYDPLGRPIETVNPDGTRKSIVIKTWSSLLYDENDNAATTLDETIAEDQQLLTILNTHLNTPQEMFNGADDRIDKIVKDSGDGKKCTTRYDYDVLKRPIGLTDALGRQIMTVKYDFIGNIVYLNHKDSGQRLYFYDGCNNLILRTDANSTRVRTSYDVVNRPVNIWELPFLPDVNDAWNSSQKILRISYQYGDPNLPADKNSNRVGRVTDIKDQAGHLSFYYDFKGNVVKKSRRFFKDQEPGLMDKDWVMPGVDVRTLSTQTYTTETTYNAVSQLEKIIYPHEAPGSRQEMRLKRNRVGMIKAVYHKPDVDSDNDLAVVKEIRYDPRGQRRQVLYGNGIACKYDISNNSYRLNTLTVGKFDEISEDFSGDPIFQAQYDYDLVGNVLHIQRDNELGDRTYHYDPLYQLILAEGLRMQSSSGGGDHTLEHFSNSYSYDDVGNFLVSEDYQTSKTMVHYTDTNRLQGYQDDTTGEISNIFDFDLNGNMTRTDRLKALTWDYLGQLSHVEINDDRNARYFYDHNGQRAKKIVKDGNQVHTIWYLNGIFEVHKIWQNGNLTAHKTVSHIFANMDRSALYEIDLQTNIVNLDYLHGDHVSSTQLITDVAGNPIKRQDYYPFGKSSIGPPTPLRFGFTGHEYDLETGLYYCGSRYYNPEIGRFIQPDPMLPRYLSAKPAGGIFNPINLNLYSYAANNPIIYYDPKGQFIITALIVAGAIFAGGAIVAGVGYAMQQSGNSTVRSIGRVFEAIGLGAMGAVLGFMGGVITGGLIGFVVGGVPGMIAGAMIGGMIGAVAGGVHGALAGAYGIYDLGSPGGWLAFFADTTWGISGTTLGLIAATFSGGEIDENLSERSNHFAFENSYGNGNWGLSLGPYIFTGGEMTQELWDHERTHTLQSRIFGPIWTVSVIFFLVVGKVMDLFGAPDNPDFVESDEGDNWDNWINPWEIWAENVEGDTPRSRRTPL